MSLPKTNNRFLRSIGIVYLLLLSLSISAQEVQKIKGKIIDNKENPIIGATIAANKYFGTFTDNTGSFELILPSKKEYEITIRSLGYEQLDTLISPPDSNVFLLFRLKERLYEQEVVDISAKRRTAFEKINWRILDFTIDQEKLLVLYTLGKKRKLGLYNLEGFRISELDLFENYEKIEKSCTGTILLIGRKRFIEFSLLNEKIVHFNPHPINAYHSLLEPCIAKVKDELIFKELSLHNKQALYIKYPNPNQPVLLYQAFDEAAAMVSQSYYNEIISLYHASADFNMIDAGVWSGDLKHLMINWDLFKAVTNYQNLETKPVALKEFTWKNNLFILDFVNKKLVEVDTNTDTTEWRVKNFSWQPKKGKLLQDEITNELYWIDKRKGLSEMKMNDQDCSFNFLKKLSLQGNFQESIQIHNQTFYYISFDYRNYTKLIRQPLVNSEEEE